MHLIASEVNRTPLFATAIADCYWPGGCLPISEVMATPPKPAIETIEAINAYASKWKAGRQALEAEYEADQERDTKQFEQDRKLIETELQADIQRFNSGQAVMAPALHDFVEEKYRLKLDPLRTAYEARKAARKAEFDRQCLAHLQEFGPKIDLIMQANIQHVSNPSAAQGVYIPPVVAHHLIALRRRQMPDRQLRLRGQRAGR